MITVDYFHVLLDNHEVIFAEGAPTESLLTGPMTIKSFNAETLEELHAIFPNLLDAAGQPVRPIMKGDPMRQLIARHRKNEQPLLQV